MKTLLLLALSLGFALGLSAGTVITNNLPPGVAIVNIDARRDGAASYNGDQSLWYQPFGDAGPPPQLALAPGRYAFRIISPADAAALYPALTSAQTNQMFTAWTYNTPWITDYLVFDAAATNLALPQIFDGAPGTASFTSPTDAYNDALSNGHAATLRTGPLGRNSPVRAGSFSFATNTTLLFVVPDYGLYDNAGGLSVLVTPVSDFTLTWATVDGGGGESSDGSLSVSGTAGQPDAGRMSDGTLSVQGGFWAVAASLPGDLWHLPLSFHVYYGTSNGLVGRVNGDGSGDVVLMTNQIRPRVSPDGRWLATLDRQQYIHLKDLVAGTESTIADSLTDVWFDFTTNSASLYADYQYNIYKRSRSGGTEAVLGYVDGYDDAPSVNPVTGAIAYHNGNSYTAWASGLWLVDQASRARIPNTGYGDFWPTWSRDGGRIAFYGTNGYHVIRPDGTGRTNLLALAPGAAVLAVNSGAAVFSPDGLWVVAPLRVDGVNGLYAIAADGSGVVRPIVTAAGETDYFNFAGSTLPGWIGVEPPVLRIVLTAPDSATLSWTPATPGFLLQESSLLPPLSWTNSISGSTNPVAIQVGAATKFFRLFKP